jgi:hypothetical protein
MVKGHSITRHKYIWFLNGSGIRIYGIQISGILIYGIQISGIGTFNVVQNSFSVQWGYKYQKHSITRQINALFSNGLLAIGKPSVHEI